MRLRLPTHLVYLRVCVAVHIVQNVGEEGGVACQGGRVLLRQREQHLQGGGRGAGGWVIMTVQVACR